MPRSLPFHSTRPGTRPVFHNHTECEEAKRIGPQDWRAGDGDRPLCEECARRAAAERAPRQAA